MEVSSVALAPLPSRVHVGHTRLLEPGAGSAATKARSECCVKEVHRRVRGAVHTPDTQEEGGAQGPHALLPAVQAEAEVEPGGEVGSGGQPKKN